MPILEISQALKSSCCIMKVSQYSSQRRFEKEFILIINYQNQRSSKPRVIKFNSHLSILSKFFQQIEALFQMNIIFCAPWLLKGEIVVQIQQQKFMTRRENQTSLSELPSVFSSSLLIDDFLTPEIGKDNENFLADLIGVDSLDIIKAEASRKGEQEWNGCELRRCTSFEQILMENHRSVLVDSMREYLSKTKHPILKSLTSLATATTFIDPEIDLKELLPLEHSSDLLDRLKIYPDELYTVFEVMTICPSELKQDVLHLLSQLFQECQQIIDHFHRRNLPSELRQRGQRLADKLCSQNKMNKLVSGGDSAIFATLVEKWMITVFLIKVGVFENELESKPIEEFLKSDIFRQITRNDLLNQHLLRPNKKRKLN